MQVLVCPTAFKGTLTSLEAALALAEAVRDRLHSALVLPLGDGGDGTYESLLRGDLGWKEVLVSGVLDPLGRPVDSRYLLKENKAFIQMSLASGMALLKRQEMDPTKASTFGTGQLILHAIASGASDIKIGLGGSATMDMGLGILRALGGKLISQNGQQVVSPLDFHMACRIQVKEVSNILGKVKVSFYCDVNNYLLGGQGSCAVFGPQKGASKQLISIFQHNFSCLCQLISKQLDCDIRKVRGLGAAGGSASFLFALGAELKCGINELATLLGLKQKIKASDLVITGEGRIDSQTKMGKVISLVSQLSQGKRVLALCGQAEPGVELKGVEIVKIGNAATNAYQNLKRSAWQWLGQCENAAESEFV